MSLSLSLSLSLFLSSFPPFATQSRAPANDASCGRSFPSSDSKMKQITARASARVMTTTNEVAVMYNLYSVIQFRETKVDGKRLIRFCPAVLPIKVIVIANDAANLNICERAPARTCTRASAISTSNMTSVALFMNY